MKRQANSEKLTPPVADRHDDDDDVNGSSSSSLSSTSSSNLSEGSWCVLSEEKDTADSPRNTAEMALVGCPTCLVYVMMSEAGDKCPRCNSTVLSLDFLKEEEINYGKD